MYCKSTERKKIFGYLFHQPFPGNVGDADDDDESADYMITKTIAKAILLVARKLEQSKQIFSFKESMR